MSMSSPILESAKAAVKLTINESSSSCKSIQNLHISTTPEAHSNYQNNSIISNLSDSVLREIREGVNINRPDKLNCVEKEMSKIRYTKEFLLILRAHHNSNKVPTNLPLKIEENETFWDPDRYFDSLRVQNIDEQKHVTSSPCRTDIKNLENLFDRSMNPSKSPSSFENLKPGDMVQINFCSLNNYNDFFVNLIRVKKALKKMYKALNDVGIINQYSKELNIDEPILLALNQKFWYRVKILNRIEPVKAFCIDNAKEFVPEGYVPCPIEFQEVPGYSLNIALHGVDNLNFDIKSLMKFVMEAKTLWMKVVYIINSKHFVELFNEKCLSINGILNPRLPQTIHCS